MWPVSAAAAAGLAAAPLFILGSAMAAECDVPAGKSGADYTFTAAYAASPPAVDEVAFTLETENLMALTYGGDFMRYVPKPSATAGVCVANMAAPGNDGVTGRWVDKWEGSPDFKTWTFHIRPGIKGWAGNEMTSADVVWTWQRAFEMKAVRYFFAKAMFLEKPEDIEVIDTVHRCGSISRSRRR